ncbi:hypothetical protein [Methylomonas sp. HYX-M1]|uniref:hypothetical protein n=1 Tax=Methylomonas sp. HYX-M1 TaxID=3139307 RepID=UPI00345C0A3C
MLKKLFLTALLAVPITSQSATFNTWTTNEGGTGNYILTVTEQATDGIFDFNLTVNPWNAEALGLFIDFGNNDLGATTLSNVTPSGQVSLFATDTSSDNCGSGCNLNGLFAPVSSPDGEWELVFRLGSQGFNNIQTFSFTVGGLAGLNDTDITLAAIRSQQLCSGTDTLPTGSCGGSDKSYGTPTFPGPTVPEPGILGLIGISALALRKFAKKQ